MVADREGLTIETVLGDIDAFWAEEFAANGTAYYAAGTVPVSEVVYPSCGNFGPYDNPAAFCPLEDAVRKATSAVATRRSNRPPWSAACR